MRRRPALAAIGVSITSIVGCIGQPGGSDEEKSETKDTETKVTVNPDSKEATDLKIFNNTENKIKVYLEVISEGEEKLSKDVIVKPYEKESNSPKEFEDISDGNTVKVIIDVEEGPRDSHQFRDDETNASGLAVMISSEKIEFQEYSA